MSAIAQALVKAGAISHAAITKMNADRECAKERYQHLSKGIKDILRIVRAVKELQRCLTTNFAPIPEELVKKSFHIAEIPVNLDLSLESNRQVVLQHISSLLTKWHKQLSPLIKESKKLERDWGFNKNVSVHSSKL